MYYNHTFDSQFRYLLAFYVFAVDRFCASNNCDANAKCVGSQTGFTCVCNEGYSGTGTSCTGNTLIFILNYKCASINSADARI